MYKMFIQLWILLTRINTILDIVITYSLKFDENIKYKNLVEGKILIEKQL